MRKLLLISILFVSLIDAKAQNKEEIAIRRTIESLFNGMANRDSNMIKAVFHSTARLQSIAKTKEGKTELSTDALAKFIKQIVSIPANIKIEERVLNYDIKVDGSLATAWSNYEFYVNEKFSHSGVDAFHLFKTAEGWKITQITDTRNK